MRKIFWFLFVAVFIFYSCEPPITFNEPQPIQTENLSNLPKRLQGQYSSLSDNSILIVKDNSILRMYDVDIKIHVNQIDSSLTLSGDTIINTATYEKNIIKREGDSLIEHFHYIDTLFKLNSENVLRKYKGYYFLNMRYDNESWVVKKIELSRGRLTISSISTKNDLKSLKEITESYQDTVPPYKFAATKKQFKKFIKSEGFSDAEIFIR